MRNFYPQSYTTLGTRSHVRPLDKLKTFPLPQCLWPSNLEGWFYAMKNFLRFDKVTKSFDHVVLQGRTTNWVRFISTTTRPHWTWQGGGLLYCEIDKPLNTWSFEIAWQVKKVLSPLPQCLKPSKLAEWSSRMKGS